MVKSLIEPKYFTNFEGNNQDNVTTINKFRMWGMHTILMMLLEHGMYTHYNRFDETSW